MYFICTIVNWGSKSMTVVSICEDKKVILMLIFSIQIMEMVKQQDIICLDIKHFLVLKFSVNVV